MNTNTAFIFGGQGAQRLEMGLDCLENVAIKRLWDSASNATGIDFVSAVQDPSMLNHTQTVQPLLLLVQESLRRLLPVTPEAVAGQSLGEYNALIAAGVISFEEALALVIKRGQAMHDALQEPTVMKAAIGDLTDVKELLKTPGIYAANYNSPTQMVLGGTKAAFESLGELPNGLRRLIPLKTEGAFHTPYMQEAVSLYEPAVASMTFHDPTCAIYQNVSGRRESVITATSLLSHLTHPVRFSSMIEAMIAGGIHRFIEISPRPMLTKLINQINPEVQMHTVGTLNAAVTFH